MTEKRFEVYYSKSKRNWYVRDNTGEIKCFGCADSEIAEYICNEWNKLNDENEQLKKENKNYKTLLQDIGLIMSDSEIGDIRNEISDNLIKPLFKANGYNIDVDTTDGFKIVPKGDE